MRGDLKVHWSISVNLDMLLSDGMRTGIATFTLDTGRCPRWLFDRMVRCGTQIVTILVTEFGPDEFVRRISDPVWFQSLGTLLAFDWNASGLTTVLCGALKEAIRGRERDLGLFICGGKGKASRKTPQEVMDWSHRLALPSGVCEGLVYNSRMAAKVDNCLVQDGYQIYHHCLFFSSSGSWAIVQQGMDTKTATARRYHWHSTSARDLVCEPHSGIVAPVFRKQILDMTSGSSEGCRQQTVQLIGSGYRSLMKDLRILSKCMGPYSRMARVQAYGQQLTLLELDDVDFSHHPVLEEDLSGSRYLERILGLVCDHKPGSYEQLLAIEGVGPKTIRALALVSEVIYGAKPSYEDPARYAFAHGGTDGIPYPVDLKTYESTISTLIEAVRRARLSTPEKDKAIRRLVGSVPAVVEARRT